MSTDRRGMPRDAARHSLAVVQLLTVVVAGLSTELVPLPKLHPAPHLSHPGLEISLGLAAAFALVAFWLVRYRPQHAPGIGLMGVIDIVLLCLITFESAGAVSQAKRGFFLMPLMAAMLRRPKATVVWTIAAMGAYIAITLPDPVAEGAGGTAGVFSQAAYIGLVGAAATLLSRILARERDHILELATARRRLLAWTLTAEDRARQDLAYQLHDGPVQNLLATLRMQERIHGGDEISLVQAKQGLRETIAELRAAIFDLHPHTLAHAGLVGALRATCADAAEKAGLEVILDLDEEAAGPRDELLFACARELVTNVVKHARATRLELTLVHAGRGLVLTVADDGRGIPALPESRPGHLGLSAMSERVAAVDGRLVLLPAERGTRIQLHLPIGEEPAAGAAPGAGPGAVAARDAQPALSATR